MNLAEPVHPKDQEIAELFAKIRAVLANTYRAEIEISEEKKPTQAED